MKQRNRDPYKHLKNMWTVINSGLQLLSAIITIATIATFTFIGTFFANALHHPNWVIPLVAFTAGSTLAICCMVTLSSFRTARHLRMAPPRWILRCYKYIATESFYEIDEKEPKHHIFTITTTIQATESGVNIFENTYRWTGRGKEEMPQVISSGHEMLGEAVHHSGWRYYYIHLGRPLNKGETAEIKTVQELYDSENKFEPYLAKIISETVDHLTLHVRLPRNSLPSRITFTVWNSEGPAGNPIHVELGHVDHRTGDIIWKIEKPILRYRYEIRWKY